MQVYSFFCMVIVIDCFETKNTSVFVSAENWEPIINSVVEAESSEFNLACGHFFVCKDLLIFDFERYMIVHIFYLNDKGMHIAQLPFWIFATSMNSFSLKLFSFSIFMPMGLAVRIHLTKELCVSC